MTEQRVTTKRVPHVGHNVYVNGKEVGTITNYSGSWWVLRPARYPLGARTLQAAAELLVEKLGKLEDDENRRGRTMMDDEAKAIELAVRALQFAARPENRWAPEQDYRDAVAVLLKMEAGRATPAQ